MKPLQKPMPPTWVAASSDETLIKAGELGFPTMGIPFVRSNSILEVKEKNDLFKESYFRAGHKEEPDIIVALHVYLHPNEDDAVRLSHPYFDRVLEYLRTSRRAGAKVPDFDNVRKEKLVVFSSPERAVEIFREYQAIGVTHIICMVNFGGAPMTEVRRTLELMSKEVFPKFK
jgi:alkanesulfonate monooxygenase SsuD/methylene tetrahydromethanopterin reductase-like flavin-dependent oxidoreductase (luciferase family)